MKITYFLRGLGIGIIFCAFIMFFAYKTAPVKMTDEEVISRAKDLGMVEAGDSDSELDKLFADNKGKEEKATTEEAATEVKTTEENTTEKVTTEAVTTEVSTESATTEDTTKADTTEDNSSKNKPVTFTITPGMYSEKVAATLAYLGIIQDEKKFNQYLNDNGYASRLVTGTYKVTPGEDYYSIAEKITSGH